MLKSIANDIRQQFDYGHMITRLIIINAIIFIAINLVRLGFTITAGFKYDARFDDVVRFFSINADLLYTATHPWVIFTHMFLHIGFWHFLFNMLFLHWFGRIVGDLIGDHRIVPLYLMGGLFGALIYLLSAPLLGAHDSYAYGASASVMAIVIASGLLAPNYLMHLLLIGEVKLKYVVLALIFLDLIGIAGLDNTGGRFAHLGGVAFGVLFITMLARGNDLSAPVNRFFDWVLSLIPTGNWKTRRRNSGNIFVRHSSVPSVRKRSEVSASGTRTQTAQIKNPKSEIRNQKGYQERLDAILDKIKSKGYESLSDEEKEFLFIASKK